ncbi:MAG: serine protease, partial [Parcubacteria group bacterium]
MKDWIAKSCLIDCTDSNALGIGFIVDQDGYIATCAHLICKNRKSLGKQLSATVISRIPVILGDGARYEATPYHVDLAIDLAIIKIEAKNKLPFFQLEPYENLEEF